jgi:lipopolysaccharide export system permease protein
VITTIALFAIATVVFYQVPELGLMTYVELVRYGLVQALSFLLPLSLLIAVVFVYGRASADNEITTLKASGIHPYRVVLPGLLLALLFAGAAVEVENFWAPRALYRQRRIPEQAQGLKSLLEQRLARNERALQFGDKHDSYLLQWEASELTQDGLVLKPVLLEKQTAPKPGEDAHKNEPSVIRAARAVASFDAQESEIALRLYDPEVLSGPGREFRQEMVTLTFSLNADDSRTRLKFQSGPELFALAQRGREQVELGGKKYSLLRRYETEEVEGRLHERFARAATPIVFLLLGVPLALIFRSGNRLVAFLLASLIAMFVYYPTAQIANVLMSRRLATPLIACWSGNVLLALIGIGLLVFVVRR